MCGQDGKTYSCGAADAECHGTYVAYKGECQDQTGAVQKIALGEAINGSSLLSLEETFTPDREKIISEREAASKNFFKITTDQHANLLSFEIVGVIIPA